MKQHFNLFYHDTTNFNDKEYYEEYFCTGCTI